MQSIWRKNSDFPKFPALNGDRKVDVLVIGGGIAGILTAYFLKQHQVSCLLAEGKTLCSGTTQNTTAKITAQHGLIYQKLARMGGIELVQEYAASQQHAVEQFATLCQAFPCDFEWKDNYIYSRNKPGILEEELSVLNRAGVPAEFVGEVALPFSTVGAVRFSKQAQYHPLRLLEQLVKHCDVVEHTFVRDVSGNKAFTNHGTITADHIVVATHFPFLNWRGLYPLKLYQSRSYVLALEHVTLPDGMYLDESTDGFSLRTYKNLLLFGGNTHRTGVCCSGWEELRTKAKVYYPDAEEVCSWAAQDCMSLDGLPYIGQYSGSTAKLYVATGFHKWGMTGAMTAAQVLTDEILGRQNRFAGLFRPSRNILHPQLFRNLTSTIANFARFKQKRCTHLGCALRWNAAEHSWDCPCHGSRFDAEGAVLENPATKPLEE